MAVLKTPLEFKLYASLRRITGYQSVESLRRYSEKDYGLSTNEALEMAYENVIGEARNGLKGVRRPSTPKATPAHKER